MKPFSKYFVWFLLIILLIIRLTFDKPAYKNGDQIRIKTTVYSDPIKGDTYQSFSAAGLKVYLPLFPEITYGDKVILEGTVNGKKLDGAKIISVDEGSFLSGLRDRLISFYTSVLPQPVAGLISGITLGSRGTLTTQFWQSVKNTGVAHVVVASGTNVTFVVSFVFGLTTFFLPRKKAIPLIIVSIILYLFVSGLEAPLIRAAVMAVAAFWAQGTGRVTNTWRNLLLAAGVMLVIVPSWISDLGFILSFVSTASIMLFERKIARFVKFLPKIASEGISTSLAAQIGVAPILFVTFGQFNLLSPVINALVLWTVPYIMVLASLGGIIGLIFPLLGKVFLYLSYPLGWWFTWVVSFFD